MKIRTIENLSSSKMANESKTSLSISGSSFFDRIGDKEKKKFYHAFEILLQSGIDIKNTLELLMTQNLGRAWKKRLEIIHKDLLAGKPLSQAMAETGVFSDYELASISIGEESGYLDQIVHQLHQHYAEKMKLRRLIISTFSYPMIVLLMTAGTLYFMLTYIVPMFANIFARFNSELPSLTQKIILLSDWVANNGLILFLILLSIIVAHVLLSRSEDYRLRLGNFLLKIPLIGPTIQKAQLSRFTMAMNFLSRSGSSLVHSLELCSNMISFMPLRKAILTIKDDITSGRSLAASMMAFSIFPSTFTSLIKIAEEVNQLDDMFEKIALQYKEDLEHQTKVVSKILEPILIMVVASIVGVILVAMYLPLFNLSNVL